MTIPKPKKKITNEDVAKIFPSAKIVTGKPPISKEQVMAIWKEARKDSTRITPKRAEALAAAVTKSGILKKINASRRSLENKKSKKK